MGLADGALVTRRDDDSALLAERTGKSTDRPCVWGQGPEKSIAARYYSARMVQLDDRHVGSVFLSSDVYFLRVDLDRLTKSRNAPATIAHRSNDVDCAGADLHFPSAHVSQLVANLWKTTNAPRADVFRGLAL
jgi:hypothetical protein